MQSQSTMIMEKELKNENKDKVVAVIRETMNYKQFKQFKQVIGNRGISERHVTSLLKSISKRDMLRYNPGIVTTNKEIIDGQHRERAAELLKRPYYYIEIDEVEAAGLEEVQQLNTYNKAWIVGDYLDSYIVKGKQDYVEFKAFIDHYKLSVEGGFILLFGQNTTALYHKFRAGDLRFTQEQMDEARELGDLLVDIKKYMTEGNYRRVYLMKAVRMIYAKGLKKRFLTKLDLSQKRLPLQFSLRDYLRMFEDILNWNQTKDIIRLF